MDREKDRANGTLEQTGSTSRPKLDRDFLAGLAVSGKQNEAIASLSKPAEHFVFGMASQRVFPLSQRHLEKLLPTPLTFKMRNSQKNIKLEQRRKLCSPCTAFTALFCKKLGHSLVPVDHAWPRRKLKKRLPVNPDKYCSQSASRDIKLRKTSCSPSCKVHIHSSVMILHAFKPLTQKNDDCHHRTPRLRNTVITLRTYNHNHADLAVCREPVRSGQDC